MQSVRRCFHMLLVIVVALALTYSYRFTRGINMLRLTAPTNMSAMATTLPTREANDIINIMTWGNRSNHRYDVPYWYTEGMGRAAFQSCTENRCQLVDQLNMSDAVMISQKMLLRLADFHTNEVVKAFKPPPYRTPQQKWVFVGNEPPSHRPLEDKYLHVFNLTMTYKRTSAAYYPYGRLVKRDKTQKLVMDPDFEAKKNVVWMVSNCKSVSLRENYVAELAKYIDVKIFGACAKNRCIRDPSRKISCKHDKDYKFYLAFENSLCTDYGSEKIWRTLDLNMIPIVYGVFDYKSILPHRSFIDVRDFKSPRHLAYYLRHLTEPEYLSYFAWKETYVVQQVDKTFLWATCQLCDFLHRTRDSPPQTVDLVAFWGEESNCVSAQTFLEHRGVSIDQPEENVRYLWSGEHDKIV